MPDNPRCRPTLRAIALLLLVASCAVPVAARAASGEAASAVVSTNGTPLAQRVRQSILDAVDLSQGASVRVQDGNGVMRLTGWTATLAARDQLARAVEGTPGVKFSYPDVVIRPTVRLSDAELRERIEKVLRGDRGFAGSGATVEVSAGIVRLTGSVANADEKYLVEGAVSGIVGPLEVVNEIQVVPPTDKPPVRIDDLLQASDVRIVRTTMSGDRVEIQGRTVPVVSRRELRSVDGPERVEETRSLVVDQPRERRP